MDANTVLNPDSRILETLAGLAGHHFRTWCYPTQAKILELMKRFTGRTMSARTLNRHLRALERDGHIRRIRRHVHDKRKGFLLRSTCYVIAGRFLSRVGRIIRAAARWAKTPDKSSAAIRLPYAAEHGKGYKSFIGQRR